MININILQIKKSSKNQVFTEGETSLEPLLSLGAYVSPLNVSPFTDKLLTTGLSHIFLD